MQRNLSAYSQYFQSLLLGELLEEVLRAKVRVCVTGLSIQD